MEGDKRDSSERLAEVESEKTDAKGWRRETFSDPREGLTEGPPEMRTAYSRLHQTPCSTTTVTLASGVSVTPLTSALQRAAAEERKNAPYTPCVNAGPPRAGTAQRDDRASLQNWRQTPQWLRVRDCSSTSHATGCRFRALIARLERRAVAMTPNLSESALQLFKEKVFGSKTSKKG